MCKREVEIYLKRGSEATFSNGKGGNSRRSEATLPRKRRGRWRRLFRLCDAASEDEATLFYFRLGYLGYSVLGKKRLPFPNTS
jgi:hypothetical protein